MSNKNVKKQLTLAMVMAMTVTTVPFNVLSVNAETVTENGGVR